MSNVKYDLNFVNIVQNKLFLNTSPYQDNYEVYNICVHLI